MQQVIVNALVTRLRYACQKVPDVPIVVAGGVAANRALRVAVRALCQSLGRHVYFPDLIYCTDNAAMVAHQAFLQWQRFGLPTADLDQSLPRDGLLARAVVLLVSAISLMIRSFFDCFIVFDELVRLVMCRMIIRVLSATAGAVKG